MQPKDRLTKTQKVGSEELDARKRIVLYTLVHEYINEAEPVGSDRLVKKYSLDVSSATVRNDLAQLEEMGYLVQPHTSAGRIPSDKGYRYYVDILMKKATLSVSEQKLISDFYSKIGKEMDDLLRETSELLSELTKYVSIVFAPALKKSILRHLDLVSLYATSILVVLITDTARVVKEIVDLKRKVSSEELRKIEKVLNQELCGLKVNQIKRRRKELFGQAHRYRQLTHKIIDGIIQGIICDEDQRVFLGGTFNLLEQPEFESQKKFRNLLRILEQDYQSFYLLKELPEPKRVTVKIGSENEPLLIQDCSLVAASYEITGKNLGAVGLLGPTRMDYAKAISTVEYIANNLSQALHWWSS